ALAQNLLKPGQTLSMAKYFTARISGPPSGSASKRSVEREASRRRQLTFLEALATLPDLSIIEGHFLAKPARCFTCGATWESNEEKMTDVNIATELLTDAFTDRFDVALIVSGDSDLVPPLRALRSFFP